MARDLGARERQIARSLLRASRAPKCANVWRSLFGEKLLRVKVAHAHNQRDRILRGKSRCTDKNQLQHFLSAASYKKFLFLRPTMSLVVQNREDAYHKNDTSLLQLLNYKLKFMV